MMGPCQTLSFHSEIPQQNEVYDASCFGVSSFKLCVCGGGGGGGHAASRVMHLASRSANMAAT